MKDPNQLEQELKDDGAPAIMARKDVARALGVNPRTVRNWEAEGLKRLGPPQGRPRYSRADVAAFFARR